MSADPDGPRSVSEKAATAEGPIDPFFERAGRRDGFGVLSILLKVFLPLGFLGWIVWAAALPERAHPFELDLLFYGLMAAAVGLLVLNKLGRTQPLWGPCSPLRRGAPRSEWFRDDVPIAVVRWRERVLRRRRTRGEIGEFIAVLLDRASRGPGGI